MAGRGQEGEAGFTLVELLLGVALLSLLIALAVPGFGQLFNQVSANAEARNLMNTLASARGKAIRRSTTVAVCAIVDGADCSSAGWSQGWLVFVDNDGVVSGGTGSVVAGDEVLRVYQSIAQRNVVSFNRPLVRYDSLGFIGDSNANRLFLTCPVDGNVANGQGVSLSVNGRSARTQDGVVC